ncbi:MAG: hypothetical protein AAGC46_02625 [Solirubrobacteraceae bacterium]|nr:hypothetical protein [Patulibacter sp.]
MSAATVAALTPATALAGGGHRHGPAHASLPAVPPATIALPNGWQPEGIAAGRGGQLYVGSIPTGAIYRANAFTGQGSVLVPPHDGRAATGLKVAGGNLIVAGASTGHAYVYDAKTGADIADITLTTGTSFINDVAIAGHTAYFTDSRQQQLYRVSLGSGGHGGRGSRDDHRGTHHGAHGRGKHGGVPGRHGWTLTRHHGDDDAAPTAYTAQTVKITGDFVYDDDPASNDANGIVPIGRDQFLVVQSSTGKLFRVNGTTGVSVQVPVTGGDLKNGDGLLLVHGKLLVSQNRLNQIAVVDLTRGAASGTIERTITNPAFRVPTTLAATAGGIYAVNARFGTPATPDTDYDVVRMTK